MRRIVIGVLMFSAALAAQSAPHQSTGMPYDDELYRHLIYDGYDEPGSVRQSWVLPYTLSGRVKPGHLWTPQTRPFRVARDWS